jgi:hypothetical protein
VLPQGAYSKKKAFWAIHPHSFERGILAFSREVASKANYGIQAYFGLSL